AAALSDTELIEAIIGRGTKNKDVRTLAKEICSLIQKHRQKIRYEDLQEIDGIGPTKASQITACFELSRRYFPAAGLDSHVTRPEDILPHITYLKDKTQEHFICITLNGAGEILGIRTITLGLLNHSLVHPREVFADAITDRAASIICVHNHPSGSLEPSSQDIAITNQLRDAGVLIGIQLIDHIIISKNGHISLRERGLL
ncbi:MAG: DNA repair protein RadC, partial [Methanoregulaceae archaeon]|nr:DNA repair protein RadC [Methanoregulaceae archaeon]